MKKISMKILAAASVALMLCVIGTSCSTTKDNTLEYFKGVDLQESIKLAGDQALRIEVDDELKIVVTSEQPAVTAQYNLPFANVSQKQAMAQSTQGQLQSYLVDLNGDINFPVFGRIHVVGMTLNELRQYLEQEISRDVNNPHVTVEQLGFRVVMLGEFANPGTKHVGKEVYTILDALGDAGDLTAYAQRDRLLLMRTEGGEVKTYRIDLTSTDFMTEPYFFLKQNDVLYAVPDNVVVDNAKYNQNNGYKLSVISTVVSAASVLASLAIALLIK